jgi:hypothetical protein
MIIEVVHHSIKVLSLRLLRRISLSIKYLPVATRHLSKVMIIPSSISAFRIPTDNVNIYDAIYDCYATVIFSVQFDGVAKEFVFFEKEARNKKMSLVNVPQNYNNKDLTFTFWGFVGNWGNSSGLWFSSMEQHQL